MDPKAKRLLRDLRAALLHAMSESQEMQRALGRLRESGWAAYVVIDERREEPDPNGGAGAPQGRGQPVAAEWSGSDSSWLRSLGIDPQPESHGF